MINLIQPLLNTLAIIGIIITAGFLVFFIGDLMLSILDPSYGNFFSNKIKNRKNDLKNKKNERELQKEAPKLIEDVKPISNNIVNKKEKNEYPLNEFSASSDDVEYNDFDNLPYYNEAEAEKEKNLVMNTGEQIIRDEKKYMESFRPDKEAFRRRFGEDEEMLLKRYREEDAKLSSLNSEDEYFNKRDDELERLRKNSKNSDLDIFFEEDDDFNFEDDDDSKIIDIDEEGESDIDNLWEEPEDISKNKIPVKEMASEELPKPVKKLTQETSTVIKDSDEIIKKEEKEEENIISIQEDLKTEIQKLKNELEETKKKAQSNVDAVIIEKQKLEEQLKDISEAKIEPIITFANPEEIKNRIDELIQRKKLNEKELKIINKEFLPLRKIKNNLESDQKKLRRKEALVAKQKVLLYGVNNVVEIDEAKAKKLTEDLDLLDGLRLSVQHCETIMEKNKERFPLLEKIYTLLKKEKLELETDIVNLEKLLIDDNN